MESVFPLIVVLAAVLLPVVILGLLNRFSVASKIVAAAVIVLGIGLCVVTCGGTLGGILDVPSALIVGFVSVGVLFLSGRGGDFLNALKIAATGNPAGQTEIKKSLAAVSTFSKLLLLSGGIGFIIGAIGMLNNVDDISAIGPNLAVALIAPFYALILIALTGALKLSIESKLLESEEK